MFQGPVSNNRLHANATVRATALEFNVPFTASFVTTGFLQNFVHRGVGSAEMSR
jgi:hypothetical protein